MNIKIGAKIKILRKRDDITQERLAEVLGVTSQAISKWESESGYPDIEYIPPIANFFNVTTDYLFDHDTAEKRRKIEEYCEKCDAHFREWKLPQERVDMMRQALAEFPAEEKLLYRLAEALYYKWCDYGWQSHTVDGEFTWDYEKHKSFDSWDESLKIMEELLATSLNDNIRYQCRSLLVSLYKRIGEKDKIIALAEKCLSCKTGVLAQVLEGRDGEMYNQLAVISDISSLYLHLTKVAEKTKDSDIKTETHKIVINLYKFVFSDGNYGFYSVHLSSLHQVYAEALIDANKLDEAFEAYEQSFEYAKIFDKYLREIREKGEYQYTSPFTNLTKEYATDIHAVERVPELLQNTFKDEYCPYYKKLHDDPRHKALVSKIEAYIAKS